MSSSNLSVLFIIFIDGVHVVCTAVNSRVKKSEEKRELFFFRSSDLVRDKNY